MLICLSTFDKCTWSLLSKKTSVLNSENRCSFYENAEAPSCCCLSFSALWVLRSRWQSWKYTLHVLNLFLRFHFGRMGRLKWERSLPCRLMEQLRACKRHIYTLNAISCAYTLACTHAGIHAHPQTQKHIGNRWEINYVDIMQGPVQPTCKWESTKVMYLNTSMQTWHEHNVLSTLKYKILVFKCGNEKYGHESDNKIGTVTWTKSIFIY